MKVLDFYTKVLTSIGLNVTSDGFIKTGERNLIANEKPFVLPTKEQLSNLTTLNSAGEYVAQKILFNPLKENVIKKDGVVIQKVRKRIEVHINYQALTISNMLLQLGRTKEAKNISIRLNQFLVLLESTDNKNIKTLVDPGVIEAWDKLTETSMTNSNFMLVKVYLKRNIKKEGEKYFRGLTITSPLLEMLDSDELPLKLRPKDIRIFKVIINYILKNIANDDDNVIAASNDDVSPTFMVLTKGYLIAVTHMNKLLKDLKFIDKEVSKGAEIDIAYTYDDLDFSKYERDLSMLPEVTEDGGVNEIDTNQLAPAQTIEEAILQNNHTPPSLEDNSVAAVNDTDEVSEEELRRMLYGGGVQQQMYTPQPVMPQQMYAPPPQQQMYSPQPVMPQGVPQPQPGMYMQQPQAYCPPNVVQPTPTQMQAPQPVYANPYGGQVAPPQMQGVPFDGPYVTGNPPRYR